MSKNKDPLFDLPSLALSFGLAYAGSVLLAKYLPKMSQARRDLIDKHAEALPLAQQPTSKNLASPNLGQDHSHDSYAPSIHRHLFSTAAPHGHDQFSNLTGQIEKLKELVGHSHPEIQKLTEKLEQAVTEKAEEDASSPGPAAAIDAQIDSTMANSEIDMQTYNSIDTLTDPSVSLAETKVAPRRTPDADPMATKNEQMDSRLARANINMQTYNSIDILTDPADSLAETKVAPASKIAPSTAQVQEIAAEIKKETSTEGEAQTREEKIAASYSSPLLAFYSSSRRRGR